MYYPNFRMKKKTPILSSDDINFHAERFIQDFNSELLENPCALDIESFIEFYLNVDMEFDYLSSNNSCLGMTVFNNTSQIHAYDAESNCAKYISAHEGTIIIDNSLLEEKQERRLRFTLGHEAGHWIFHKAYFGYNPGQMTLFEMDTPYIQCRSVGNNYINKRTDNWDDEKWMEWQADKFSACLLMPETSVRMVLEDYQKVTDIDISIGAVDKLSDIYNVSKQAAFYRLCDLKYIQTNNKELIDYQLSLFE